MNRFAPSHLRFAVWTLALVVLAGIWGQRAASLQAQQPDADAPATVAEEAPEPAAAAPADVAPEVKDAESFGHMLFVSSGKFGVAFYVILAIFSIVGLAVILERLVRLQREKVMPYEFVRKLRDLIGRNEDSLDSLRNLAESSKSPIANILRAGVLRAGRPLPEVEKAMEDAAARELAAMRSRNHPLSVVGSIAPLIGLLGTVVGMIFAFRISSQEGLGKAELLAQGIYLALMTTAAGLTIAIPSLLFHAWFNASADRFLRDIDETLMETMPAFTRMENQKAAEPVEAA